MNMQPTEHKKKKYTVKTEKKEDYSETNPRSREEFAKGFIQAYDGALKNMKNGTRSRSLDELLKEAYEYIAEEEKNGRY